jgi:hypothetical protein
MCFNIKALNKKRVRLTWSTAYIVLVPMFPDDLYDHGLLSYPNLVHLAYLKLAPPLHSALQFSPVNLACV